MKSSTSKLQLSREILSESEMLAFLDEILPLNEDVFHTKIQLSQSKRSTLVGKYLE